MEKRSQNEVGNETKEAIAIIGVGFKGPGAENLEQLWDILETGQNHVVEHPKDRWNVDAFYDADPQADSKYYTKKAGYMSNPLSFDNDFFGINDMESDQMDPQQKHVLECTYKAMELAGLTRGILKGSKTGVYIGAMNCDYRGLFPVGYSAVSNYTVTGVSNGIIASRVSYVFDLRGPCLVVDTGCSSALIAIHTASQGLLNGDCSLAICGGTNFIASPDTFVHLSKAKMVSPTGQCHAFSELADGYTRGEGCGIVILKKLSDARRDQDRVLAVIQTGTNQDGHDVSPISAPSKTQQISLLEDMYRTYSLEQLDEVEYIEAHGTGTQAGDFAECHALGEFFNSRGSSKKRLIGSIKTNIGHLEAAAGIAGIIKVLLMMNHNKIVPSLLSGELNKKINFDSLNLKVVTEQIDWATEKKVASVNSFGFGGSNCHAIVSSVATKKDKAPRPIEGEKDHCIVCFSGKDEVSLMGSLKDLVEYKDLRSLNLYDISYTSTRRRDHYSRRKAFVVASIEGLINSVAAALPQPQATARDFKKLSIIFVFGGMGTSWNGMCQEMLGKSDVFRSALSSIDECLQTYVDWSLINRLNQGTDLNDPFFSPIAIFACQVGLAKVWQDLGVKPAVVVGQSVGEVAAAYISGRLSLQDAVKVIYERSLLLSGVKGGKMFIVKNMDINLVKNDMSHYCGKANVSVEYSSLSCAVSCYTEVLDEIKSHLLKITPDKTQITFIDLTVPTAYHSHLMDSIKTTLREKLKSISPEKSPTLPMISTVTGKNVNDALDANYWMNNLREPVKFYDAIRATYNQNDMNIYLEIGPRPVLKAHMQNVFTEKNVTNVASMTQNVEWNQFLESVAAVYSQGVEIDWEQLTQLGHQVTPVPRYCFHPRKGFFKSEQAHLALAGVNCIRHTHPYVFKKSGTEAMVLISENTFPSVYEHKVSNMLVIPGAFYAEVGFGLTKIHDDMKAPMYTVSATFKQPFRLPREGSTLLVIECLKMSIQTNSDSDKYKILIKNDETILATLDLHALKSKISCQKVNIQFLKSRCPNHVKKEDIYCRLKKYGFTYGQRFSLLEGAHRSPIECIAEIVIPESLSLEIPGTTIHPSVIDCMMQTSAILEDMSGTEQELLPVSIGKLTSYREIDKKMYVITTKKVQQGDFTFYDVTLTALDGQVIAHMENLSHTIVSKTVEKMDTIYNSVWTKIDKIEPNQNPTKHKFVFITDYLPPDTPEHTLASCHLFDSLQQPEKCFNGNMPTLNNSFDFILVLIANCNISDSDDGGLVLEKTTSLCLFLQQLYNYAFTQRFQKPIFVFTKDAFQLESTGEGEKLAPRVNPIMTALWGLFRCAVHESTNEFVFAIDLNVPTNLVNLSLLTSVANNINDNAELQFYPEFLVLRDCMYVNEIVKLGTDTRIPNFRLNHADKNTNCSILSSHPLTLDTPCCVYKQNSALNVESNSVEIDVSEAAIQNPNLFSVHCLCGEGENASSFTDEGFMIFALEVRGVGKLNANQNVEIVSCFPVQLASKVVVPKMVTLDTSMLYQYKLGDFTKLTVLKALCSMVKSNCVTVLASATTFHLAQCLKIMLNTLNSSMNVIIVMIEQLDKANKFNDAVISLVLIDKAIIRTLDLMTDKSKQFITINTLMKDTTTLFSITFPSVHLDLLDTERLFSPIHIKTAIPQLTEWINKHHKEVKSVVEILHSQQDSKTQSMHEQTHDLKTLLEFQTFKMSPTLVKTDKTELFRGDSVYIVVGGLTGLGWLTVRHLAENGAGGIAIVNRRTANEGIMSAISSLCLSTQSEIGVFSGDVSDFDALTALFLSIKKKFHNKVLRGIFFGAAVLEDKPLLELTRDDFRKVMLAKVKGAWNMHLMTKSLQLDYFVLYSSASSIVGNFTQANYGAGNAFMDGLAFYRRSMNLAGQSINWGALDLGILENKEEIKKRLEAKGFAIMSEEVTKKYMQPLLLLNFPQLMPCIFRDIAKKDMYAGAPAKLRKRMTSVFRWYEKEEVQVGEEKVNMARSLPPDQRLPLYEQYVVELSCKVLNVGKDTLKSDSDLVDYGLDSIVAVTMINYIYLHVGCRLQFLQFLSGKALVQDIARMIDEAVSADEHTQARSHNKHCVPMML